MPRASRRVLGLSPADWPELSPIMSQGSGAEVGAAAAAVASGVGQGGAVAEVAAAPASAVVLEHLKLGVQITAYLSASVEVFNPEGSAEVLQRRLGTFEVQLRASLEFVGMMGLPLPLAHILMLLAPRFHHSLQQWFRASAGVMAAAAAGAGGNPLAALADAIISLMRGRFATRAGPILAVHRLLDFRQAALDLDTYRQRLDALLAEVVGPLVRTAADSDEAFVVGVFLHGLKDRDMAAQLAAQAPTSLDEAYARGLALVQVHQAASSGAYVAAVERVGPVIDSKTRGQQLREQDGISASVDSARRLRGACVFCGKAGHYRYNCPDVAANRPPTLVDPPAGNGSAKANGGR